MEVVGAVTEGIDAAVPNCRGRTDLGEMAQTAAAETIAEVVGGRVRNLFGTTPEEVRQAFARVATSKQFGLFARDFFGRWTFQCLDYFLSKALAQHVGGGQRIRTLAEQSAFEQALATHGREAAKIVEEFAGGWFGKTNWETGGAINRVRSHVGNAIRRALQQIRQYDVRLADHLVRPILNLGHTISYVPRDGTSWSLAAQKAA